MISVKTRSRGRPLAIEPAEAHEISYEDMRYFHGRKVVAPLKRALGLAFSLYINNFHGRKVVAPLKLLKALTHSGISANFHGRKVVAPLKPSVPLWRIFPEDISTAEKSWPH